MPGFHRTRLTRGGISQTAPTFTHLHSLLNVILREQTDPLLILDCPLLGFRVWTAAVVHEP